MEVRKNKRIKNIISFILAIILMFSIVLAILSSFVRFIFLNPSVYLNVLHSNKTETQIYETIESNLKYALVVNNIPENVLDNVITEEEVRFQVDNKIQSIIVSLRTGRKDIYEINTDLYLNRFNENLYKYFNENSVVTDDALKSDVDKLKESVQQMIVSELEIINGETINQSSKFDDFIGFTSKFNSGIYFLLILPMILVIVILLAIWHSNLFMGLKWIGDGVLAAGIILSLVFDSGYISKFYENVIIYTPYLKELISQLIKQYLRYFCISGAVILVLGIVLCVITNVKKEKK